MGLVMGHEMTAKTEIFSRKDPVAHNSPTFARLATRWVLRQSGE
jgi:hypothetical protein